MYEDTSSTNTIVASFDSINIGMNNEYRNQILHIINKCDNKLKTFKHKQQTMIGRESGLALQRIGIIVNHMPTKEIN